MTAAEYESTEKKFKESTCNDMSEYIRRMVMSKPIVSAIRNKSLDDLMAEMSQLRTELNRIGNNFNQSVKRLHTLNQLAEFRTWVVTYDLEKKTLANKMDEIKSRIKIIAESWLQE